MSKIINTLIDKMNNDKDYANTICMSNDNIAFSMTLEELEEFIDRYDNEAYNNIVVEEESDIVDEGEGGVVYSKKQYERLHTLFPHEHFEGIGICGVHKFKVYLEDDKDIHTFNRIKRDNFDNNPLFEGSTLSYSVSGKFELF
jgi:hypothetical protein